MDDTESLAHTKWECKYHVVWIPKYRRKALYAELRKYLGPVLHELAQQRECRVEEGHLQLDHVHMLLEMGDVGSKTTSGNPGRWDPGLVLLPALADGGQFRAVELRHRDAYQGISAATGGRSRKVLLHLRPLF